MVFILKEGGVYFVTQVQYWITIAEKDAADRADRLQDQVHRSCAGLMRSTVGSSAFFDLFLKIDFR